MRIGAPVRATPGSANRRAVASVAIWVAVVAWGGSFVAARMLLHASAAHQSVLTPTTLAATRFGLASLCFLPALLRAILRHEVSRRALLNMAVLGQLAFSFYFWLQYTGVQRTSAGIASILVVGLTAMATLVFSRLLG